MYKLQKTKAPCRRCGRMVCTTKLHAKCYPGSRGKCKICSKVRHYNGLCRKCYPKRKDTKIAWCRRALISLRNSAKRKRREFDLKLHDLLQAFPSDKCCPVLGRGFVFVGKHELNPSVDRINPAKGYIRGNIAIISWRANAIKRDATLIELKALVSWLEATIEKESRIRRHKKKRKSSDESASQETVARCVA